MKLYELFDSKALAIYWKNESLYETDPMIGAGLFPAAKQVGLDLKWIKGTQGVAVALQPSAFDTKAPLRDRIGVKMHETELPFFKEGMRLGEKDRQDIMQMLKNNPQMAKPILEKVFDDTNSLLKGALVQSERMIMSLLHSGGIDIKATEETGRTVQYTYNYDPQGTWATKNKAELLTTAKWTLANKTTSNPIQDILDAQIYMKETYGVSVTKLLMNTTTLTGLLASDSIIKSINPLGATNMIMTRPQIQKYVEDTTGITMVVYDKMYKDEQGVTNKYYPDSYVSFLPTGALGRTRYGTTPEEADLLNGVSNASVTIVNTGIAIKTIKEADPVNVQTIVSEIVLPSFEAMDSVYVLKVS